MTGEELYNIMKQHGRANGLTRYETAALIGYTAGAFSALAATKCPRPEAIKRCRAIMAGETVEPVDVRPKIKRPGDEIEAARRLTELAKETRGPGQTIADRLKELRREQRATAKAAA